MTDGVRLIRISTRRTGERVVVRVYVYDELQALRDAAARFTADGDTFAAALGICQMYSITDVDSDEVVYESPVIVRLWRGALNAAIVTHELCHAACEIYGRSVAGPWESARSHMRISNEVLAHLHSDLNEALNRRLWALGLHGEKR